MTFKNPEFLYALFAILIPILIHLFNFRRYKKLWFSNIEFLKNITVQTRKQNKLKQLLVLLTRILAIVFLVLAFSGPQFNNKEGQSASSVLSAIYVDNSFSMMAEGENGRLFDEAIGLAREIIVQSPRDTRFILVNNESSFTNRVITREAALSSLDDHRISASTRMLSSLLFSVNRTLEEKEYQSMDVFLLSDFQKYSTDLQDIPADTVLNYYFLPLAHAQNRNIYVDSVWTTRPVILPGKPAPFRVRIRNVSENDVEKIPLKVNLNGQQKAVAGVDIPAGSFIDETITLTPTTSGWQRGLIEIEDYPITFDDNYYFSFFVNRTIDVLEITGDESNTVLEQFYGSDSVFSFTKANHRQVNYNSLNNYNLIVLNELPSITTGLANQIKSYLEQGGNVMFIPAQTADLSDENKFLQNLHSGRISRLDTARTRVIGIKQDHELFKEAVSEIPDNASLPAIHSHLQFGYSINSGLESLMTMLNGDAMLLTKNIGNGRLFLLGVTLSGESSNFNTHALFVPVMYGAALGTGSLQKLALTIGKDELMETYLSAGAGAGERPFSLKNNDAAYSFIPEQKLIRGNLMINVRDGIEQAGFYDLNKNDSLFHVFSFNFNRNESNLEFLDRDQLTTELQSSGILNSQVLEVNQKGSNNVIDTMQKESEFWKLFIIFALLMLLAEVLILRFWK